MLSRYGLIITRRDLRRSVNGTMRDHENVGDGGLHHFFVNDNALYGDGVQQVMTSLTQFAEHMDSDTAIMTDALARTGPEAKATSLQGIENATKSWFA